ncbi:MAG: DUF6457 domain-containing protein [Micrococcales bacterium]|nr:DUF6457 domain-containing protein [Micrococcales bacterium]
MDELAKVDRWMVALRGRLDLDGLEDPDMTDLLDTVRAVAHQVLHAGAPVAAFAAGYAVARADGSAAATARVLAEIRDLADETGETGQRP